MISEQKLATMTRILYLERKDAESQRLYRTREYFLFEHESHDGLARQPEGESQ